MNQNIESWRWLYCDRRIPVVLGVLIGTLSVRRTRVG